jgi:hypothetical protein
MVYMVTHLLFKLSNFYGNYINEKKRENRNCYSNFVYVPSTKNVGPTSPIIRQW